MALKSLIVAVLVLFAAHSTSVAGERDRQGSGMAQRGQHGSSGSRNSPSGNWQNRGWNGGGHWGGGWGRGGGFGNDFAGGILGGIIGGAIGSIFAPAPPEVVIVPPPEVPELQPFTPAWYSYCTEKFKSFEAQSGTYTGFDGEKHFCR